MIADLLAQVAEVMEPTPMLFKRLGEQAFLVILLVTSNYLFAKVLLSVRREHLSDLKEQLIGCRDLIKDAQAERDRIWNFFTAGKQLPQIHEPISQTTPPPVTGQPVDPSNK